MMSSATSGAGSDSSTGARPSAPSSRMRGGAKGLLRGIPAPLRAVKYDLVGELERALLTPGYRPGETLHFFAYDWRQPVVGLGAALAAEVRRLAGAAGAIHRHPGALERGADRPRRLRRRSRAAGRAGGHLGRRARGDDRDGRLLRRRVSLRAARAAGDGGGVHGLPGRARFDPRTGGRRLSPRRTRATISTTSRPGAGCGCRSSADIPTIRSGPRSCGSAWRAYASSTACWTRRRRPAAGVHLRHRPADADPDRRREGARAAPR